MSEKQAGANGQTQNPSNEKSQFIEEELRLSSDQSNHSQSSPRISSLQLKKSQSNNSSHSGQSNQKIESYFNEIKPNKVEEQIIEQQIREYQSKKYTPSIIEKVYQQAIMKEAELQRIGGTFNFFYYNMNLYNVHLMSRKNVIVNMQSSFDKSKAQKGLILAALKQYFKQYVSVLQDIYEKSYKYAFPERLETTYLALNMREQLKGGLDRLIGLRRNVGNDLNRLQKYIKTSTIPKIQKSFQVYWNNTANAQKKIEVKKKKFEQNEKKFKKRIQKLTKVYQKSAFDLKYENEDLFVEMTLFLKDEKEIRDSIFEWGKQITPLRRNLMKYDYALINELHLIIEQYKQMSNNIYQFQIQKEVHLEKIKAQINEYYLYQNLCMPIDIDYIKSINSVINKKICDVLIEMDFQEFLQVEYFHLVVINTNEFLKGMVVKIFALKNNEQELVRSISGNLIYYNRKFNDVKNKMNFAQTTASFLGNGVIELKEKVKGIIFDKQNVQKLYFKDDNRAQELLMYLNAQFGKEEIAQQ